jgi:hypothetical protein
LWNGQGANSIYFSAWAAIDDNWSPIPNKDTTTFATTTIVLPPDTLTTFNADPYDLGTAIITAIGYDTDVDSVILNYGIEYPATRDVGELVLASSDTNAFKNLQVIVPVETDSTFYSFTMWCKIGDYWTSIPNMDTVVLNTIDQVSSFTASKAATGSGGNLSDSLFAYYNLDEASGSALDQIGSNDLAKTGTVTQGVTGKVGDCYTFITDGYLGEIDTEFEFPGSFSLSYWIKTDVDVDTRYVVSNFGSDQYGYTAFISNGRCVANFRNGAGVIQLYGGAGSDIDDDAWHHVVVSYSSVDDTVKLWVDGNIADIDHAPLGVVYNANCRFTIGRRDGTGVSQFFWNGEIDEIAVYRGRELTEGAVDSLWNSGSGLEYPFASTDSLQLELSGFDPEVDSVRINYRYDSIPTSRTDGTLWAAFSDTADFNDTTFLWGRLADTAIYWAVWSGKNDSWTVTPNSDSIGLWVADTANSFEASFTHSDASTELADNLFAYYDLEETAGNVLDQIGSNDLTVSGSVTRGVTGITNDCYTLVTNGYLGEIDTDFEFTGSYSLSLWVKTNQSSIGYLVSTFGASDYGYTLFIYDWGSGVKANFRSRDGVAAVLLTGSTTINDDSWHHVVATYNATDDTLKLWVDGEQDDTPEYCTGPVYSTGSRFTLGRRDGTGISQYFLDGELDEIAIYKDIELSEDKIDSLYNAGTSREYPFTGTQDADSMRLQISGFDASADSFNIRYAYDTYPDAITDGSSQFAFALADTADYNDTTFEWTGYNDTIVYYTLWSREAGTWTVVPNKDTVQVGVPSAPDPPPDPTGFEIYWAVDFENHAAPIEYTTAIQSPEFLNDDFFPGSPEKRWPSDWANYDFINDWIVIDPLSGSKVLKYQFSDTIMQGYDGQTPSRGGDGPLLSFGTNGTALYIEPQELYFSYNFMLRPGWLPSGGGKFPGLGGGRSSYHDMGCPPTANNTGFKLDLFWHWATNAGGSSLYNAIGSYGKYYNMSTGSCPVSELLTFGTFQPVGTNLNYHDDWRHAFYLDVSDSIWYNITLRYVCNTFSGTTPNADGIMEGFVNGYLV